MHDTEEFEPLPESVAQLLSELDAPPRLVAHLTLVHDAGVRIVAALESRWPDLPLERESVELGAAVHDIGKVVFPVELSAPGHRHEGAGEQLLRDRGFSPDVARFARTHGQWATTRDVRLEDLLVAWPDKLWRGVRDEQLEEALTQQIAAQTRLPIWQVFAALDDIAAEIAQDADWRLAWQNQHPIASD